MPKISELTELGTSASTLKIPVVDTATNTTKYITLANLMSVVALNNINIDGGAIDGTPIGGTSPSTGAFTSVSATATNASLSLFGASAAVLSLTSGLSPLTVNLSAATKTLLTGNDSLTANTGSSQGDGAITCSYNIITTCANAGDAVTLPTAVAGYVIFIGNVGANSADVFPASSDAIDALGTNNAYALAANKAAIFFALSASQWATVAI